MQKPHALQVLSLLFPRKASRVAIDGSRTDERKEFKMTEDFTIQSLHDQIPIHLTKFQPEEGPVRARVLILHGMCEHRGRYRDFAQFLANHDLEVYTMDWRGHGETLVDGHLGYFASESGYLVQIGDLIHVIETIDRGDLPFLVFAHSMGTLYVRFLLQSRPHFCDLLLLSGPPANNSKVGGAILMARLLSAIRPEAPSSFLQKITFADYSKSIPDRKTELDWISCDPENVAAYIADPLCGFPFTNRGFLDLYLLTKACFERPSSEEKLSYDLPIHLFRGKGDPCPRPKDGGPEEIKETLQAWGFSRISEKVYDHSRHELLFDLDKDQVYQDLLATINNHLSGGR